MIRLCGLWKNKSEKSGTYLSGRLGNNAKVLVFQNKHKKTDKDPDYVLCIAPFVTDGQQKEPARNDDDIPF
jgi:hypothetical protein